MNYVEISNHGGSMRISYDKYEKIMKAPVLTMEQEKNLAIKAELNLMMELEKENKLRQK
jgi:hypothetical protein